MPLAINDQDKHGNSPLMLFSYKCLSFELSRSVRTFVLETLRLLLQAGANIDIENMGEQTCLDLLEEKGFSPQSCYHQLVHPFLTDVQNER